MDPLAPIAEDATAALFWRLASLVFVLLWSGGYSFAKLGLQHVEPMTMLVRHYGLAAAALALFLRRPVWPRRLRNRGAIALTGFLIQRVYFGLADLVFANSIISIGLSIALIQRGDATRISTLMYLVPPLAMLLAWVVPGEPMGMLAFAGLVLAAAGVRLVTRATG